MHERSLSTAWFVPAVGLLLACSGCGSSDDGKGARPPGLTAGPIDPGPGGPMGGAPAPTAGPVAPTPGTMPPGGPPTNPPAGPVGNPSPPGIPGTDGGMDQMPGMPGVDAGTDPQTGEAGSPDAGPGETTNPEGDGTISIEDAVPGFASQAGGTTGGGQDLSGAIMVSSMSALRAATSGSSPAIVLVQPGNYAGELAPGANKTIIGVGPGVKITGNLKISGSDRRNIIVRNIAIQGERCSSYDACKSGADGVYVGNGAHHVWLDHLDVADGQDGNCDITQGGDYVTVSWTHFHYTYDKEHRFSNLIAGSDDEPASVGKLHITYMNSHWGDRIDQRQPRGRFGNIHMLNNYHHTGGSQIHGVGKDMALIAENSVYDEGISIWKDMGSPRGWRGMGNIGTGKDLNESRGSVFQIPYAYTPMPASEVVAAVTKSQCGAGNTCQLAR